MIAAIEGRVEYRGSDHVVLQVGPIALKVSVPAALLGELGPVGSTVRLHTHLYVREDQLSLFGFATPGQLSFFELLLSVSGIGPKAALAVLSAASVEELQSAIAREDAAYLSLIPGIGKKTAARLILELRGKIDISHVLNATSPGRQEHDEVYQALLGLGYTTVEAQAAVRSLPSDGQLDLSQQITLALRYFDTAR